MKAGLAASLFAATGLPVRAQRRGGTLRLGLNGAHASDNWDSRTHDDQFMMMLGHGCVFDCLTQIQASGALAGELATHWEGTADAKTWVFHLRGGVKFHNGKPFVAEDVVASFVHHIKDLVILKDVIDVQKRGKMAVAFTLRHGNPDFPFLMSDHHLAIYPADAFGQNIGTGLYRAVAFEPGVFAKAERVQDHYKDGTAGWFDHVELYALRGDEARVNALIEGRVDAINDLPPHLASTLEAHPGFAVQETVGNRHVVMSFDPKHTPFDDPRIRAALRSAIDRKAILETVMHGRGKVGQDHPFGPLNQYYDPSIQAAAFDPKRAKELIRSAGVGALKFDLHAPAGVLSNVAHAIANSAGQAEIEINVIEDGQGTDNTACLARMTYWNGRVTEGWTLAAEGYDAVPNHGHSDKRQTYHDIQQSLADDGAMIIPLFPNFLDVASAKLAHGGALGALRPLDSGRAIERWWFV
ncbi:MAG: ABC transporter substrate-binding protein [Planktomarina sp.]